MPDTKITDVADRTFDYVIAGGGTAGLALAARLTEDPSVSVLVLEAGKANLDDPKILIPGQYGQTFFNPQYDWTFFTKNQKYCNDKPSYWARGKGLGGSSIMNFMVWSKPTAQDVNAFEKLGNKGWNWEDYDKYSQKCETFHEPTKEELSLFPHSVDSAHRGKTGPVQSSMPHHTHSITTPFLKTLNNMGFPSLPSSYGGEMTGALMQYANIDPRTHTRSYAATAYYQPNQHRPNLTVLTEATVHRVLFASPKATSSNDDLTATGLDFLWTGTSETAKSYVVHARKEVILSAGTVCNPPILELSGIGRQEVLEKLGVDVKIALPGVGENVQEHLYTGITFELDSKIDHQVLDMLRDPTVAAEHMKLHATQQGLFRTGIPTYGYLPITRASPEAAPALLDAVKRDIDAQKAAGQLPPGRADQLDLQLQSFRDEGVPEIELISFPGLLTPTYKPDAGKIYSTTIIAMNHPLSRGTIHAASTDPTTPPEIDPHFFENDFDLETLVQATKFVRKMGTTEPWKSTVVKEVEPGPECATDHDIREYIKNTVTPVWHAVGSCSMLPREKQGVVDSNLKVYGTKNLRIVDVSIVPLHISAHTQITAYVVAEKAADIILGRV